MKEIQIELFDKQADVFHILKGNNVITELLIGGGSGGAKTYTGCAWLIDMCLSYPGINAGLGRADITQLKQTTMVSFYEVVHDMKLEKRIKVMQDPDTKSTVIYFIDTGSKIFLIDLKHYPWKDPEFTKLGGLLLTIGFIDELPEIIKKAYSIFNTRVGRWKNELYGIKPIVLSSCNPVRNRVYQEFYKPRMEGKLPQNRLFFPMLAKDNPFCPKSYIAKLDQLPPGPERERLRNGNWEYDDTPGHLYEFKTLGNLFTNPITLGKKYIICDVATTGKDKAIIEVWEGRKVIDHKVFLKCQITDIENQIKEFSQQYMIPMSQVLVDQAGEGKGIPSHLGCIGFVGGSSPIVEEVVITGDKFKPNYQNLRTQCYFELQRRIHLMNLETITNSEWRQEIIDELNAIVEVNYDNDRKKQIISKDQIKENIGRSPDRADTISMRCYFELLSPGYEIFV